MAKKANQRKRVAIIASGIGALALAGGVAAQFTASTTSAPQSIGTGTVAIDLTNESASWIQGIENLAAGDTATSDVRFENKGTIALDDSVTIKVAVAETAVDKGVGVLSTALVDGAGAHPLQLKITSAGLDNVKGNADDVVVYDGTVAALGTTTFQASALNLTAGGKTDLDFKYTVPAAAGNEYQGQTSKLTYTVDAVQRDAGDFVNTSPTGSLNGK